MKPIFIITMILILNGCKVETKEQKAKRLEAEACELAFRYLSECAYEHKGVRLTPLSFCDKRYAEKILSYPCDVLVDGLRDF